ncbi:MAG: hypothetical protein PF637_07750 [Spirochaetes bacterium]|jgi:Spy/CpxP family protein refolding chaperone|nr:hypothetical protein [Spirochaetota bacterium]
MNKFKIAVVFASLFIAIGGLSATGFEDCPADGSGRMGRGGFGHGGFGRMIHLREELNLSEAQYTELKAIEEKYAEERYKNRGDRTKMRELFDAQRDEVYDLLDAKQRARFEELLSENRSRGRGSRSKRRFFDSE